MKILAFADTHSDIDAIKRLASLAKSEKVDALLCAGDISDFGRNLNECCKALDVGLPLIYIHGNHEEVAVADVEKRFKFVENVHGRALVVGGVLFLGCGGGGFSRFFTAFEKLIPMFKAAVDAHNGSVVLVTHAPPHKTRLDRMGRMDVGAESIRKFIEDARGTDGSTHIDFAVSGHIHENAGKSDKIGKTVCINPGKKGFVLEV